MKIKATRNELNECLSNVFKRIISEGKTNRKNGFEKAFKFANRDIEKDVYGGGFKSYDKPHKTKKDYSRKGKNKFSWGDNIDESIIDFTHPDDDYYDDGYELDVPNINDIVDEKEFEEKKEEVVTIKTDIDNATEQEYVDKVLENFDDAEFDIVNDYVSFNIPKSQAKKLIKFLRDEEINIIK